MKHECAIVKDLLPLYQEELTSPETGEFVKEHLDGCESCRGQWEELQKEVVVLKEEVAPLKKLKKRLHWKKIKTIVLSVLLTKCLLVGMFLCMNIAADVPWTEGRAWAQRNEDGSLTIYVSNGDEFLDGWSFGDFDGGFVHGLGLDEGLRGDTQYYSVSARTTLWSRIVSKLIFWDAKTPVHSMTYWPEDGRPVAVFYNQAHWGGGLDSGDYVLIYSDEGYSVPAVTGEASGEVSAEANITVTGVY